MTIYITRSDAELFCRCFPVGIVTKQTKEPYQFNVCVNSELDENASIYTCCADLDLGDLSFVAKTRPYVRLKMNGSTPLESQLWTSQSSAVPAQLKKTTCGWCTGLLDGKPPKDKGEVTLPVPVCDPCYKQQHKARSSGQPNPRFDRVAQLS